MKKHHGFTLNELIITLAIMAVLLGLAVPAFSSLMRSIRLTTIHNELIADLNYARSEAIKRESPVIVKATAAPFWEMGWTVETVNCTANCLLRTHEPLTGNHTLRGKIEIDNKQEPLQSITFLPSGGLDFGGYLTLCDTSTTPTPEPGYAKQITFNRVSHFRSVKDTNNNQLPDTNGVDITTCE